MVKLRHPRRLTLSSRHRRLSRRLSRRPYHRHSASCARIPNHLAVALASCTRAIRAHRRLIQLAPAFFDATKVEYHRLRRAEDARWRAEWEPILNRVYGNPDAPCTPVDPLADHRPFPRCPRIVRAVEHELLTLQLALASAGSAFAACNNRPHHLPSLHLLVRLVNAASAFQELIFGAPRQPEAADQFIPRDPLAELRRAYPDPEPAPPPPAPSATSGSPATVENAVSSKPETPPAPSPINPAWPPPDDKRDLTPFAMVRGDHGLLCLRRLTNP